MKELSLLNHENMFKSSVTVVNDVLPVSLSKILVSTNPTLPLLCVLSLTLEMPSNKIGGKAIVIDEGLSVSVDLRFFSTPFIRKVDA